MATILTIEDNADILENMGEILELAGYSVLQAADGKAGVELALAKIPDLIVCDIMMPVLDGYSVLLMLQRNAATRQIPFIFLSAKAERNEVRKGMELGADDYITKPFEGVELLHAIEVRLRKSMLVREAPAAGLPGMQSLMEATTSVRSLDTLKDDREVGHLKKKQLVYNEGGNPLRIYYVCSGKVKTFKRNDDGKELIVGLYKEGDFFGYNAVLEGTPYKESAQALEESQVAMIPRADFERLLNSSPEVMRRLMQLLAHNILEKEEQLLGIAYNSLRKKVAEALVTLYRKYRQQHEDESDASFTIDISRENLAALAGVAKESLIRTLGDFRDEQLLTLQAGTIHLSDPKGLERMLN